MQTRRQFVRGAGGAAAALVLAPQALAQGGRAPLARGGRFTDGVMSGDPAPRAITLWTRLDEVGAARRSVELEVARDKDFRRVVARKLIPTSDRINGAVKARIANLDPHEQYFYRFSTAQRDSSVGRFRTALPADSRQPVNFAFFSCQDFTHGFYNAHALLAREDDLDFVVNLGDYIYAETYHSRAGGTGVRDDGIGRERSGSIRVAETLQHYRDKYSLYRTDANLREVHRLFPLVTLWDDHEVQNNYAGKEADGGLPANERYSRARRARAYKAYFESMPTFPTGTSRTYRSMRFGTTVELFVMDQRQYRANQPCNDEVAPPCAEWDQPRDFLGRQQMAWVKNALSQSPAAWKVMANELMIMPAKVLGGSYFTYDNWQGYPREREELLAHIKDKQIKDVVFITGDIHTFITGDVRTQMGEGESVALEFVGGSVTSPGLGEIDIPAGSGVTIKGNDRNPKTDPAIIDALKGVNPWVDQGDFDHHGYGVMRASTTELDVKLRRLSTIKRRTRATEPDAPFHYTVKRGQTSIKGQSAASR